MVTCGECGKEVLDGKNRNKVSKRFCSDRCRWDNSNRKRFDQFTSELMTLLKKYRYLK